MAPRSTESSRSGDERISAVSDGIRVVPMPSHALDALVGHLLVPIDDRSVESRQFPYQVAAPGTAVTEGAGIAARRDEILGRLAGLLCHHLRARRGAQWGALLRREDERGVFQVWRGDGPGRLQAAETLPAEASPLPLLKSKSGGIVIANASCNRRVDPRLRRLLGSSAALLLPLIGGSAAPDVLALSLRRMPLDGEIALALALSRRASTIIYGRSRAFMRSASGQLWSGQGSRARQTPNALTLSPREREVVQLLASGLRNREIAQRLRISERTVKFHLSRVFVKLGVNSRTEVLLHVVEQSLP